MNSQDQLSFCVRKMFDKALPLCKKALDIDKEEDDEAIKEYSSAIDKQSMVSQFYWRRGMAHIGKRNFDASIRDLTRSYELERGDTYQLLVRKSLFQGDFGLFCRTQNRCARQKCTARSGNCICRYRNA